MDDFFKQTASLIDLDSKVQPQVLSNILGVNISLLYQESQKGRLPAILIESTYRECIQMYVNHFKKNVDLKILREQNEHDAKLKKIEEQRKFKESARTQKVLSVGDETELFGLQAAKLIQSTKLDKAREAQLWLRIAIERQDYISSKELFNLLEPFMSAVKNTLNTISDEFPETQEKIDEGLESLYTFGVKLLETTKVDQDDFVEQMMSKSVSMESVEEDFSSILGEV